MKEELAWNNFVSTGKVVDYLNYVNAKDKNMSKGNGFYAGKHERDNNIRKGYFWKW